MLMSRHHKTMIHDTGFEFMQPGWIAFHAVAIPAMMYIGASMIRNKRC